MREHRNIGTPREMIPSIKPPSATLPLRRNPARRLIIIMLPRITLRPFEASDADDFMECVGDSQVTRYSRIETLHSREEALKYLKEVAIPHPWFRAICLESRAIGFVYVLPGEPGSPFQYQGDISYALSSQYWGRGIVTQALKMVASSVFGEFPKLVRLQAMVDARNNASQRVLEKAGFVHEGLLRKYYSYKGEISDLHVYSFLSSDPMPEQPNGIFIVRDA